MGVKKKLFHGLFGQCSSLLHEEYFKFKACWFTCTFISFYFLIPSTLVVNAGYPSWNFVFIYKTPLGLCVYRMPCLTSWRGPSNLKSCIRIRNTKNTSSLLLCSVWICDDPRFPENPGRLRVKRLGSQFCDSCLNFLPLCADTLRAALWWSVTCHGEERLRNAKAAAAAISWREDV